MTALRHRASAMLPLPLAEARRKVQLVKRAELRNHSLFKSLPESLCKQLKHSPRLAPRLHALLAVELRTPVMNSAAGRNFHLISDEELDVAASCLGLSYAFSMGGGALSGEDISKVTQFCDAETIAKALRYAATMSASTSLQGLDLPDQPTLSANGWNLFRIWADEYGVNADWRIPKEKAAEGRLGPVSRLLACELAQRILADVAPSGEAV